MFIKFVYLPIYLSFLFLAVLSISTFVIVNSRLVSTSQKSFGVPQAASNYGKLTNSEPKTVTASVALLPIPGISRISAPVSIDSDPYVYTGTLGTTVSPASAGCVVRVPKSSFPVAYPAPTANTKICLSGTGDNIMSVTIMTSTMSTLAHPWYQDQAGCSGSPRLS